MLPEIIGQKTPLPPEALLAEIRILIPRKSKGGFCMNVKKSGLFWGVLLIGAGLLALADQMGYVETFSPQVWIGIFAVISLLGLISYALSGWKQWGWLFPTGVFGGLAVTLALATNNVNRA